MPAAIVDLHDSRPDELRALQHAEVLHHRATIEPVERFAPGRVPESAEDPVLLGELPNRALAEHGIKLRQGFF